MTEFLLDGVEREDLCDLMHELGSDAPTLLGPWTTHDLAAHLVLREHDLRAIDDIPWSRPAGASSLATYSW
jgi:hypothetical protein